MLELSNLSRETSSEKNEVYQAPIFVAENKAEGTFASGCPTHNEAVLCRACEMTS